MTAAATTEPTRGPSATPAGTLGEVRMVVTGDNRLLLDALVHELELQGAEVLASGGTQEAYRLTCAHRPDVSLLEDHVEDLSVLRVAALLSRALPETRLAVLAHRYTHAAELAVQRGLLHAVVQRSDGLPLLVRKLGRLTASEGYDTTAVRAPAASAGPALSRRETDVLRLLVTGATNAQIGERLGISVNTVRTHVQNLLRKLDVPQRQIAAIRATTVGAAPSWADG